MRTDRRIRASAREIAGFTNFPPGNLSVAGWQANGSADSPDSLDDRNAARNQTDPAHFEKTGTHVQDPARIGR